MRSKFPGIPVFPAIGLGDVFPYGNLENAKTFYQRFAAVSKFWLDAEAKKTLTENGFYFVKQNSGLL